MQQFSYRRQTIILDIIYRQNLDFLVGLNLCMYVIIHPTSGTRLHTIFRQVMLYSVMVIYILPRIDQCFPMDTMNQLNFHRNQTFSPEGQHRGYRVLQVTTLLLCQSLLLTIFHLRPKYLLK
mmetsp:Transcript_75151/g.232391  ORF Transcript_75151/g.232391 Transcript_75151/m.232391 type:complete len:122 (+) Transcript_75151:48-413(+)